METESGAIQYYLQDELGSPLRVLYKNGYGEIYGYDEFGNDFCGSEKTFNAKTNTVFKENVNHLDIQDIVLMKLAEHILHKPESINLKEECLRQKM